MPGDSVCVIYGTFCQGEGSTPFTDAADFAAYAVRTYRPKPISGPSRPC